MALGTPGQSGLEKQRHSSNITTKIHALVAATVLALSACDGTSIGGTTDQTRGNTREVLSADTISDIYEEDTANAADSADGAVDQNELLEILKSQLEITPTVTSEGISIRLNSPVSASLTVVTLAGDSPLKTLGVDLQANDSQYVVAPSSATEAFIFETSTGEAVSSVPLNE